MKFIVLGNKSVFTYKSVFPLIRERRLRLGARCGGAMFFDTPRWVQQSFGNACWLTNLRHDVRRSLPPLKTMAENLATNKRLRKHLLERYGKLEYPRYDNYAAIEVPFVDAIPSDYDGVMGVPVTFLDKWDPDGGDGLDVVGHSGELANPMRDFAEPGSFMAGGKMFYLPYPDTNDVKMGYKHHRVYNRIVIQPRHELVGLAAGNIRGMAGIPSSTEKDGPYVDGRLRYCRLLIRPAKEIRP